MVNFLGLHRRWNCCSVKCSKLPYHTVPDSIGMLRPPTRPFLKDDNQKDSHAFKQGQKVDSCRLPIYLQTAQSNRNHVINPIIPIFDGWSQHISQPFGRCAPALAEEFGTVLDSSDSRNSHPEPSDSMAGWHGTVTGWKILAIIGTKTRFQNLFNFHHFPVSRNLQNLHHLAWKWVFFAELVAPVWESPQEKRRHKREASDGKFNHLRCFGNHFHLFTWHGHSDSCFGTLIGLELDKYCWNKYVSKK